VDSSIIDSARAHACTQDISTLIAPLQGDAVGRIDKNVNRTGPTATTHKLKMAAFG
jgi:hypothetical protein